MRGMKQITRTLTPALLATLGACTIIPQVADPRSTPAPVAPVTVPVPPAPTAPPAPAVSRSSGTAIGQTVRVGAMALIPQDVIEDSRCPSDARCVWPGRLVVTTRIDGAGWSDTAALTLGEPYMTHGVAVTLVSGNPAPQTGREIAKADYRFTYDVR